MHHEMSCHNAVFFFTVKTIAEAACRKEEMLFEFLPLFLLLSYEFSNRSEFSQEYINRV